MKTIKRNISVIVSAAFFVLGLMGSTTVLAATAPDLGAASSYAIFGKAGVTNNSATGTTHIWGNVGADSSVTNLNDATQVDGSINAPASGIEAAVLSAYGDLASQAATGTLDLAGTHTITPGVYTIGATTLNGTLTLDGAGVYILRSSSSISTSGAAVVSLINGATPCNVFWQIPAAMTIGTGTQMVGTIITNTELISLAAGASLQGRAFSRIAQVTLDSNSVTQPTCAAPVTTTINVVKVVINDNGRTKAISDFPLFVNSTAVVSGVTNSFAVGTYTISETADANYTKTFSGDCNASGSITLASDDDKVCVITNDDIGTPIAVPPVPPIIDVVKVPSPLSLPNGAGPVTYTYTLKNIGTVPVTDITMVGDTCSPIKLISGDTNSDSKLDLTESWKYTCTKTTTETHTNIVTATGWANGLSTSDVASAIVVVGVPVVPPLIHVIKVPKPLTFAVGGGTVTYTASITNPGTVALSNVKLTDNKCSPMKYISGDTNSDSKLDITETWVYTCQTKVTKNTTNTAKATGEANGLTVQDIAIANVTVASATPALPDTGIAPQGGNTPWNIMALVSSIILAVAALGIVYRKNLI